MNQPQPTHTQEKELRLFRCLCDLTQFIYENGKEFLFISDLRMDSGHVTRNHNDSLHADLHWPQISGVLWEWRANIVWRTWNINADECSISNLTWPWYDPRHPFILLMPNVSIRHDVWCVLLCFDTISAYLFTVAYCHMLNHDWILCLTCSVVCSHFLIVPFRDSLCVTAWKHVQERMGFFVVSWHSDLIIPRPQDVLLVSLCLHKGVCFVQVDAVGRLLTRFSTFGPNASKPKVQIGYDGFMMHPTI